MNATLRSKSRWKDKLERPQEPRLVRVPAKMAARFGKGMMLIPTPKLVDEIIRKVAKGKLVTVGEIRKKLAHDHRANVTCPLTTGIFVRIAAEAAEEERQLGAKRITPYWRVVRDDGGFNPKFPGGAERQARYLRAEGFSVVRKGVKPVVRDFELHLTKLR